MIRGDCALWTKMNNSKMLMQSVLEVNPIEGTNLCSLSLNGGELWFGTLQEINAVVKSMLRRLDTNDFFNET